MVTWRRQPRPGPVAAWLAAAAALLTGCGTATAPPPDAARATSGAGPVPWRALEPTYPSIPSRTVP
ncbi:MAG: hypothetical protein ACTHOK_08910, partial [Nocardioidaceae bacterium]